MKNNKKIIKNENFLKVDDIYIKEKKEMDKKTFNDLVDVLPYLKKRGAFGFNDIEGFCWTANPTKKWRNEQSVIIDNWGRFYDLDCPYDNIHLFVVEQILEEATNKLEMLDYMELLN